MIPVLATVPIETAIWIVLLVIGVISSIVSNARKAVRAARSQTPRVPVRAPVAIEPVAVPVVPPVIVPSKARRAAPVAAPPVKATQPDGTRPFRGMFQRGNLVNAIVAAEVLGPPKALQEQSIWSPRHSEPSI